MIKANEGRLQTVEHILSRVLMNKVPDLRTKNARFYEDYGTVDCLTKEDLTEFDINEIERSVQSIVSQDMEVAVKITPKPVVKERRGNLVVSGGDVRVVTIGIFDSRLCNEVHVSNTSEIGMFAIDGVARKARGRYRITFSVS
jgi:Ser-tRNA(Ala) deacylase AlaX